MAVDGPSRYDTVLVADADEESRAILGDAFEQAGFAVLSTDRGDVALALARKQRPGAALLAIDLPGLCGYEICHRLHQELGNQMTIVFVSGVRTESYDRIAGLLLGADEYVVKPFDPNELVVRVQRQLERVPRTPSADGLTPREIEVLALLAEGYSQREIAERLVISSKTAASHIQHILEKLRVHSRAQAVAAAHRYGIVPAGP